MSDYTQINDYSAKDALSTGNPLKIIKGSDIDAELAAISAAIATKFDTTSIADAAEAQTGTSNTVVMTPGRTTTWAENGIGILENLRQLSNPAGDRLFYWNDTTEDADFLTLGTGFSIAAGVLSFSSEFVLTAGNGLSYSVGGTKLGENSTINLDINSLTAAAIAAGDFLSFADITDSNTVKKITFADFEAALNLANIPGGSGTVPDTRQVIAGVAMTGGGALTGDVTLDVNIGDTTELSASPADDDLLLISDTSDTATHKHITVANAIGTQLGEARYKAASAQALSAATETDVAFGSLDYNNLQRGTFTTPNYTAGASGAVLLVSANVTADTLGSGESLTVKLYEAGSAVVEATDFNQADSSSNAETVCVTGVVSLAAGQQMKITAETSQAESLGTGIQTSLSIVELG